MIGPSDVELARRCVEAHYAGCPQVLPGVPADMRGGRWRRGDWEDWILVPSRLAEADIVALEAELPFRLPPLFRAFLVSYFVLDMDFGEYRLPELPSDGPLVPARRFLVQLALWDIGYAQFGDHNYGDPLCFDLRAPTPEGTTPSWRSTTTG